LIFPPPKKIKEYRLKTVNKLGVNERAEFESSVYYHPNNNNEDLDEDEDEDLDDDAFEDDSALFTNNQSSNNGVEEEEEEEEFKVDSKFVTTRKPIVLDLPGTKSLVEQTRLRKIEQQQHQQAIMNNSNCSNNVSFSSSNGGGGGNGSTGVSGVGLGSLMSSSRIGDYLCKCDMCKEWIYSRGDKVRLGDYVSHRECVKCFVCDNALHEYKIYPQINSQNNGMYYIHILRLLFFID
jgi:hypothetical protein